MRSYNYGESKNVYVTDDTVKVTPSTFHTTGLVWEPESIKYFYNLVGDKNLVPINILDIGAQSGLYTLYAKFLPNCKFFSYEPNVETFNLLKDNCVLNNIENATLVNKGLSDAHGKLVLKIPKLPREKGLCCFGDSPLRFNDYFVSIVDVTTIDAEFFEKDIPIHFIKCDTEGWEPYIMKGGEKTITKWHPEIFLEVNEINLRQCNKTKDDLLNLFKGYGYTLVKIMDGENYHFSYVM
jgi:FkbM family methyltransferase